VLVWEVYFETNEIDRRAVVAMERCG